MKALEKALRQLFGWGIIAAFTLLALGWLFGPALTSDSLKAFAVYSPKPVLSAVSFSNAGLVVLVLIPFFRVLVSGLYFKKSGERVMFCLSLLVFCGLCIGLWLGLIHPGGG